MTITQIWESPTNEGTFDAEVGRDYTNSYDRRLKGLGRCLSISGLQNDSGGYYEVLFENGRIYLNESAVGTRVDHEAKQQEGG